MRANHNHVKCPSYVNVDDARGRLTLNVVVLVERERLQEHTVCRATPAAEAKLPESDRIHAGAFKAVIDPG